MAEDADVPPRILGRLRPLCLALPEVREEPAWTGVRWRVRTHTFAHVLTIVDGRPPTHARAAGVTGARPTTVMTFRAAQPELDVLRNAGPPYFYGGWGRDVVGMVLSARTDWDEVRELVTESYCVLAPKKLVALVDRPDT